MLRTNRLNSTNFGFLEIFANVRQDTQDFKCQLSCLKLKDLNQIFKNFDWKWIRIITDLITQKFPRNCTANISPEQSKFEIEKAEV